LGNQPPQHFNAQPIHSRPHRIVFKRAEPAP